MNWAHALLVGYIGTMTAIVAGTFRKRGWLGKISGTVVFMVVIIVWDLFDTHHLIPRKGPGYDPTEEQQFEKAILSSPAFQVIKEQEPELTQKIISQTAQVKEVGSSEQQVIDAIQSQTLQLQIVRLQQAPDANVIEYMRINLEQIISVARIGNDEYFHFLFPAMRGEISLIYLAPCKIMNRRMMNGMSMIRVVYGPNRHTVTAEEKQLALQDLRAIDLGLIQHYGPDIQVMVDPTKAISKEKTAYEIVRSL